MDILGIIVMVGIVGIFLYNHYEEEIKKLIKKIKDGRGS